MTLRLRITLLSTALLCIVLAAAGFAVAQAGARDTARSLEARARERLDAAVPRTERAPGPPRSAADAAAPEQPATGVLPPEADGARVEVFHVDVPGRDGRGAARLRLRLSSGTPAVDPAWVLPRAVAAAAAGAGTLEAVEAGGTTWLAAVEPPRPEADERAPRPAGRDEGPADRVPPPPPASRPPRPAVVAFLESAPAWASHRAFVLRLALIGAAALAGGAVLAWGLAGRMLRPVRAAALAAEGVERPEQRLPVPRSRDELARLVVVLNGMLARLEATAERERLFLATASHELRRPLTALIGELDLAASRDRDAASLRAAVGLALGDARAMHRLVEDLLHHARAAAGGLRLSEGEVDLAAVVREAVERSRRSVAGSPPVEVVDLPEATVRGDADALRQILENLVVNAATHGGADARVAVRGERAGGDLLVHVDDDGPGIEEADLARIFEPFGRGDRSRTTPGFGLGLAIARDLALAHGGTLTALSPRRAEGAGARGSRFTLRLPASRVLDA